jgi:hypothetical protein
LFFQKTINKVKIIDLKKFLSENFRSKKFLSENFEVAKSFPSREKKLQICPNAPTPLSFFIKYMKLAEQWA